MFQLLLTSFLLCSFLQLHQPAYAIKNSYVVYLGSHSHGPKPSPADMDHERAKEAIFYSYNRHINGFAALLEEHEAAEIRKNPKVVSVFLGQSHKLHTTRSWGFLGQEKNGIVRADSAWVKGRFGQNVIIGSLDTGVWPESKSFRDDGYGPIPKKWRGGSKCELYSLSGPRNRTLCNRKLIGAKTFYGAYEIKHGKLTGGISARDEEGHGTHTLSTAGGNFVRNVSVQNNGNGTAKGGSPRARLAVYKVCWGLNTAEDCNDEDMIFAFDQAISDGVDILSVSLGRSTVPNVNDMLTNGISIGSFHAVSRGIIVVASAGNDGPEPETVTNVAPWVFTIASGSIDREFSNNITLGNGQRIKGTSLATNSASQRLIPVVIAGNVKLPNATFGDAQLCKTGTLDPTKVRGNILVCQRGRSLRPVDKGAEAKRVGAVKMILQNDKPDVTAPGQDIIAAFSPAASPTNLDSDDRHFNFNALSGTSMACPHVAGITGLLKTRHPDWSPAMIKSAIMTTASIVDNTNRPIEDEQDGQVATPFHYGTGYVKPNIAMDPGFVYDLKPSDYLNLLCASAYEERIIEAINYNKPYKCPRTYRLEDFNYPSITVPFPGTKPINVTRTLTNVGPPGTYTVNVKAPRGVKVVVLPTTLTFQRKKQQQIYRVILQAVRLAKTSEHSFGDLTWTDGKHKVRSPIVIPQYAKMAM
ncbi:hypothetical protein K1719_014772 [Acacia pycnantha]|nr:hypothetical protein K1719_014772 [Acacia pycnantha]